MALERLDSTETLARLLASAPDLSVRNGQRALEVLEVGAGDA